MPQSRKGKGKAPKRVKITCPLCRVPHSGVGWLVCAVRVGNGEKGAR